MIIVILLLCRSKKRSRQQEPEVLGHTELQTGIPIGVSATQSSPPQKPSYASVLKTFKLCEKGKQSRITTTMDQFIAGIMSMN